MEMPSSLCLAMLFISLLFGNMFRSSLGHCQAFNKFKQKRHTTAFIAVIETTVLHIFAVHAACYIHYINGLHCDKLYMLKCALTLRLLTLNAFFGLMMGEASGIRFF
jgi:hypothetical protein